MAYLWVTRENKSQEKITLPEPCILTGTHERSFKLCVRDITNKGGNGTVFNAYQVDAEGNILQECAIKMLNKYDGVREDRFINEKRLMHTFSHPKIAKIVSEGVHTFTGSPQPIQWIAMERGGDNLRRYIEKNGKMDTTHALPIVLQICECLQHIHDKEVIHRDLKPDNIIWATTDNCGEIRLIDFGIAKYVSENVSDRKFDSLTVLNEFVGPVTWASTELLSYARNKAHPVTHLSDLFQLGKIIWYIMTDTITSGYPSKKLDPTNGRIHSLVCDLLCDDPSQRPQSADDVAAIIRSLM